MVAHQVMYMQDKQVLARHFEGFAISELQYQEFRNVKARPRRVKFEFGISLINTVAPAGVMKLERYCMLTYAGSCFASGSLDKLMIDYTDLFWITSMFADIHHAKIFFYLYFVQIFKLIYFFPNPRNIMPNIHWSQSFVTKHISCMKLYII